LRFRCSYAGAWILTLAVMPQRYAGQTGSRFSPTRMPQANGPRTYPEGVAFGYPVEGWVTPAP
jgi:hypothetical protein